MAKRKRATGKQDDRPGKTRFELRFSADLYNQVKTIADRADISINQFMQGLAQWAAQNAIIGEPERNEEGFVKSKNVPGVVFFGKRGHRLSDQEREELAYLDRCKPSEIEDDNGTIYFTLDFTERRVVRDDAE